MSDYDKMMYMLNRTKMIYYTSFERELGNIYKFIDVMDSKRNDIRIRFNSEGDLLSFSSLTDEI